MLAHMCSKSSSQSLPMASSTPMHSKPTLLWILHDQKLPVGLWQTICLSYVWYVYLALCYMSSNELIHFDTQICAFKYAVLSMPGNRQCFNLGTSVDCLYLVSVDGLTVWKWNGIDCLYAPSAALLCLFGNDSLCELLQDMEQHFCNRLAVSCGLRDIRGSQVSQDKITNCK